MARWILDPHSHTKLATVSSNPPRNPTDPAEDARLAVVDTEATGGKPRLAQGVGTRYTCPDCGGVLFERREGLLERFECSVGHVFSIESLSSAQAEALESALWAAVRSLEDRAALLKRLAGRGRDNDQLRFAATFERQAQEALDRAQTIRHAIQRSTEDRALAAES